MIYANADIVSAPVIGQLFPQEASGATTVLGYLPWYSTLWFELATRWVPFHRELWEVGPWIASLAGIALVAWSTAKVAGRWAGCCVLFVLACAGNRLLPIQFASDLHGATAVYVCVLDAFLVLLVLREGRIAGRVAHALLCALVACIAGAGVASDELLIPAGLVPFAAAGVAQLWRAPRVVGKRIAVSAIAVSAGAAVAAAVAVAAMHSVHVYAAQNRVTFVPFGAIGANVAHLFQSLMDIFNGDFGGEAISARSMLALACACVVVCAVVAAFRMGREQLDRLRHAAPAIAPVRDAHVTFWTLTVLLTSSAFVFSSFAQVGGGRYLVAAAYGLVVLGAVAVAGHGYVARLTATAGACLILLGSVVSLAANDLRSNPGHYPQRDFARFLRTFAEGEGLTYGYAAYWVAAPATWETSARVHVYPVLPCSAPARLCTYPLHEISSWYVPRPNTKTFLIDDRRYGPGDPGTHLGGTESVVTYGDYTIYVYDYDIAANLGDWRLYGVDAS